jgi:hypothetical protein
MLYARNALVLALLAALFALGFAYSCNKAQEESNAQIASSEFDLNNPPKPPAPDPIGPDVLGNNPEEIWAARCGLCHDKTRGVDRYKGEEWISIIERMMKKPGSMMNAGVAGISYVYLYELTTGKKMPEPDRQRLLNPPVNTSGFQDWVGGQLQ